MSYNSSKTYSENLGVIKEQTSPILNQKQQDNLINSVGASWSDVGKPNFKVETQDEWYAVFAVWYSQQIETLLFEKYGFDDTKGACSFTNKLSFPQDNKNLTFYLNYLVNAKENFKEQSICYNDIIVYKKPFDKIDYNNLSSNEGRLDKTSIKNYNGYIPSYAEVIKAYGPSFSVLRNLILKFDKKRLFNNYTKSGKPYDASPIKNSGAGAGALFQGGQITSNGIHNFLTALEVGSAFIPGVGLGISFIVGLTDAFMYASESEIQNDPSKKQEAAETAMFALLLTVLPELKLFTRLSQSSKSIYYSLIKKVNSGNLKQISPEEIKFLNNLTTWDLNALSSEIKVKLKKLIVDAMKNKNIDKATYDSLNKLWKSIEGTHEFKDTLLGVIAGFGLSKKGRDFVTAVVNKITGKGVEMSEEQVKQLVEIVKDVPEVKQTQLLKDLESKPKETLEKMVNDTAYMKDYLSQYNIPKVEYRDTVGIDIPADYTPSIK